MCNPDDLDTPNCMECLARMEPAVEHGVASWVCPSCGAVQVIGDGAPEAAAWVNLIDDDVPHLDDKNSSLTEVSWVRDSIPAFVIECRSL
jgi:hypothetical protein